MSPYVMSPNNPRERVDLLGPATMSSLGTSLSALPVHIPADRRSEANSPWSSRGERVSENKHTLISSTVLKIPFLMEQGDTCTAFAVDSESRANNNPMESQVSPNWRSLLPLSVMQSTEEILEWLFHWERA